MEALSAGTAHFPVLISVTVAMRTEAASPAYSSEGMVRKFTKTTNNAMGTTNRSEERVCGFISCEQGVGVSIHKKNDSVKVGWSICSDMQVGIPAVALHLIPDLEADSRRLIRGRNST